MKLFTGSESIQEEYIGLFSILAEEIKTHTAILNIKTVLANKRWEAKGETGEQKGAQTALTLNLEEF